MRLIPLATAIAVTSIVALTFGAPGADTVLHTTSVADQASPTAPDTVAWSVAPVAVEGENRVSFRVLSDPGATTEDALTIYNRSARDVSFSLLASDGFMSDDGSFDVLAPGVESVDVGTWIDVQPSVDVPALSEVTVPFSIHVPENAAPGDHPGGIVASVAQSERGQVGLDTRVGVRVHLRVTGEFSPVVAVSNLRVSPQLSWNPFEPGQAIVSYTLTNTGNIRLGSSQLITMNGPFGIQTGTALDRPVQREILPGDTMEVTQTVASMWPLGWIITRVDATPALVGEDRIDVALVPTSAQSGALVIPVPQLLLLALIAVLVGAIFWRRRRAKARFDDAVAARVEALQQPAERPLNPV